MSIFQELEGTMQVVVRPDGARLHAMDAGTGPAVVLVHGCGLSSQEWSLVAPALIERGYRVVAYDHRAHGLSTAGRDGVSSCAAFEDLKAVVAYFDLRGVTLVGRAMGAFVVIGALADAQLRERTRATVLVAATTGLVGRQASPSTKLLALAAHSGALPVLARAPGVGTRMAAQLCGSLATPEVVEATRRGLATGRRAATGFVGVMARESVAAAVPAIDLPVTVVCGAEDDATPSWQLDLIVERAPQARVVTVPGAGHMTSYETPEVLVEAVASVAATPEPVAA